jgi:hypothetical protein
MSDPWVDPRIDNPWLQGLPTQSDLRANEFGMGEFTFDPDALEQREDMNSQFKEYLKIRGIYLEDVIPNLPQEIERPTSDWNPYTSEILDTYRNDEAYNRVAQLVDSGEMGYEDALLAVEQEAMEKGWGMPMLNSDNQQVQFYNNQPQPSMTQGELRRQQAADAATEAGGMKTGDPTKDAWLVSLDAGEIIKGPDGSFTAAPSSKFDMDEFDSNAESYMTELAKERRSQGERDAALAQYADYVDPRYLIDVKSMENYGLQGAKTDYAVEWDKPKKQDDTQGRGQQPAAAPPSASIPMTPPGPSLGGFVQPLADFEGSLRTVPEKSGVGLDVESVADLAARSSNYRSSQGPNTDLAKSSTNSSQTSAEWRRADSQARQRQNNERVNAENQASRDRMNVGYQRSLQEYKQNNAVASKQQQRMAMMDEFMNSYYRGGA